MIHPSPTAKIAPTLARGTLVEHVPETDDQPAHITLSFANSSNEMRLVPANEIATPVGKRIVGTIRVQARRIDVVETGGRYVEPVQGRPRRVQGAVVAIEESSNSICVNAGVPIFCKATDPRQKATQFEIGQFVSMDVLDGATFTPESDD